MKTTAEIAKEMSRLYLPLPEEEQRALSEIMVAREVEKGERLLHYGQVSQHIAYVERGIVRQYYYKAGRDVTEHFACEHTCVCSIKSLFTQAPTSLMVEALCPSSVYLIPYRKLKELSRSHEGLGRFCIRLLEQFLLVSQDKADSYRYETARERYLRFVRDYPDAARQVSVKHIASYLLVAPETLSRVRAELLAEARD